MAIASSPVQVNGVSAALRKNNSLNDDVSKGLDVPLSIRILGINASPDFPRTKKTDAVNIAFT